MISKFPNKVLRSALTVTLLGTLALTAMPARADNIINVSVNWDSFPNDAQCSLREAVVAANTDTAVDACPAGNGADTIVIPGGVYELLLLGTGEDASLTGDLDITADLTIIGAGSEATTITANSSDRAIDIIGTPIVNISGLKITGGLLEVGGGAAISNGTGTLTLTDINMEGNITKTGGGGGIENFINGTVTINDSSINGNIAEFGHGGGVFNEGTITITHSSIDGNIAKYDGGGIINMGTLNITNSTLGGNSAIAGGGIYNTSMAYLDISSTVIITNSTLSDNSANSGGGIYNLETAIFINSTLSGNTADGYGGGIYNKGTVKLYNATIAYNTADLDADEEGDGGGVFVYEDAALNFANSIIARNIDNSSILKHSDCSGQLVSRGYNLLQNVTGCTVVGVGPGIGGNLFGVLPHLGPLQDNGGPTWTHALLMGSPAIDKGNPFGCKDNNNILLVLDQRGFLRARDGDGNKSVACDMGAFEK